MSAKVRRLQNHLLEKLVVKAAIMLFASWQWIFGDKVRFGRQLVSRVSLPSRHVAVGLSPVAIRLLHLRHRSRGIKLSAKKFGGGGFSLHYAYESPATIVTLHLCAYRCEQNDQSDFQRETKPKVLIITGPTAVGKSGLAEELCRDLNGEIISADSVQIYRHLNVGSAKPTAEIRTEIQHHLIDTRDPNQEYNAAIFAEDAHKAISDIVNRGKLPVVVGGTNFYLEWLLYGKPNAPAPTREASARARRQSNEVEIFQGDWNRATQRLQNIDPVTAERISANNWYRMQRALEVYFTAGKPLSHYYRPYGKKMDRERFLEFVRTTKYDYRCYFITRGRVELFRAIDRRCELMVQDGLLEEVVTLIKSGKLIPQREKDEGATPAERSIGYRQALDFHSNATKFLRDAASTKESSLKHLDEEFLEFLRTFMAVSRQFAQRQLKSFRREPMVNWVEWSPNIGGKISNELDLSTEAFWNSRCGLGPKFAEDEVSSSQRVECFETNRFPTATEQKQLIRLTKEYQSHFTIYNDPEARRKTLMKFLELL